MSFLDKKLKVHDEESIHLISSAIYRACEKGLNAPGIEDRDSHITFAMQIIESIRRVQFVLEIVRHGRTSRNRIDPTASSFDPIRGAIYLKEIGEIEEASWLVFLSTHFGQRPESKWSLMAEFYKGDRDGRWSWERTSGNSEAMLEWLNRNSQTLRASGRFGNHRKYESLNAYSENGTGSTLQSYVGWIMRYGSHREMFHTFSVASENDPKATFSALYEEMAGVRRFGRTAKFDYLCMLGKTGLANVWPGSMHVKEATGPKRGGKLLLGQRATSIEIERSICLLDDEMNVGMQVFEDALCNWQKSPDRFLKFRG